MSASTNKSGCKYLLLLGLNRIEICEPLGRGDSILAELRITNSREVVGGFLTPSLAQSIGGLEMQALSQADALLYAEGDAGDDDLPPDKALRYLAQFLHWAGIFSKALWMVKDNATNFELGFLQISQKGRPLRCHSNFLAQIIEMADGTKSKVKFSRDELRTAREIFRDFLLPLAHDKCTEVVGPKSSLFSGPLLAAQPAVPRLKRAIYFLSDARTNRDLGMKIAMYCSMFETLFSTDASEITHKIAHRIAIFLEETPEMRCALYGRVKKAYSIRSKVVHGSAMSEEDSEMAQSIAVDADEIARRVLVKISGSPLLVDQFNAAKKSLDEWFLKASFGG